MTYRRDLSDVGILTYYFGNKKRGIYTRFNHKKADFGTPFSLVQDVKIDFLKKLISK